MPASSPSLTRRSLLAASAATGALSLLPAMARASVDSEAVRPFRAGIPEEAIVDLRRRLATTRWPLRETVTDQSQGVQLAKLQDLLRYWMTDYNWRKVEAKLNALPMFVTEIDGLAIHFIHVRSRHENAMPMIMTHGWPGSILEFMKVVGPLTDPTAHGGAAEDAFHLVVPSIPGFGFSGKPTEAGWGSDHIGRAWGVLMRRLGYDRYVSQGGDCGSVISHRMALQKVPGLIGIHVNMPGTVPPEIASVLAAGGPTPSGLTEKESAAFDALDTFYKDSSGYAAMMVTRPQTIGYSLVDSPVGLAAWIYEKFAQWTYSGGDPERVLTKDEMLDDISLYWLTESGTSAAQIYWEDHSNNFNAVDIADLPVAVTVFPGEIYCAPRSWAERCYHNLIYFHEAKAGGHFAAWEQPEIFTQEVRAAFKSLR
ncbi:MULTISPECIES: epoxide hydrolase [unclassified Mesorhizobium]|uniref:epoxide hydrolase family protein n=1 Tax=unclassified Mesorhizobium TaxID=325217 RepID=UPI0003D01ABF|nr:MULTISPECIES: epoxide hydrolase [unclassified Mesorhizobium]ESZ12510.1 multidrug MFS transporter [Mesorhizobium sp. L48C026A00]RWO42032.1 MAG: epoxide hydrolase [Mesorhizobium sp.]TIN26254.1 MAG: alpha/beta fold hydrolase [Mesorhizobium sp.]TIN38432.1 MAG: alpha/beta fold hydrolase [Mesorhizobium sp.]TJU80609.1 MAG: alpha/beta fold hydrolase [Mesorhizobium sp.]